MNGALHAHEITADDAAVLRMLRSSSWAPAATVVLPSGREVTGAEMQKWARGLDDSGERARTCRLTDCAGTPPYPPYAEITRLGRWTYGIDIVDGLASMSHPWHTLGRHRAERKARRMLAWYTREGRTAEERWTIR